MYNYPFIVLVTKLIKLGPLRVSRGEHNISCSLFFFISVLSERIGEEKWTIDVVHADLLRAYSMSMTRSAKLVSGDAVHALGLGFQKVLVS